MLVAAETNFLAMFEVPSGRDSCNESMSRGVLSSQYQVVIQPVGYESVRETGL